jgi:hypothetical protein
MECSRNRRKTLYGGNLSEPKQILITISRIMLEAAVYDVPCTAPFETIMNSSVEITEFYKVASLSINIWMPEFVLN